MDTRRRNPFIEYVAEIWAQAWVAIKYGVIPAAVLIGFFWLMSKDK